MATSKAPKHDFAPAWLKIPDQDSVKPSGPKSAEHSDKSGRPTRKDDYYNYNRYGSSDYMYAPLQRQRSFDNYYDERRYSPQKFRHHSVDDDYYNAAYGYGYYNGYYSDNYGNHYRSQPSLYRDAGKYTHPNARYGQGPPAGMMNGAYPPYYDPYMYEYYGDPYYPSYMHRSSGNSSSKRGYSEKDRSNSKGEKELRESRDTDHRPVSRKRSNSIEDEFPSLKGDVDSIEKSVKPVNGSTVWDKPPSSKPLSGSKQASVDNAAVADSMNSFEHQEKSMKLNGSTFKTFKVSSKSIKEVKAAKDLNSNTSKSPSPPSKVSSLETSKEGSKQASSPSIEILNTRLVTQPKNLADKKSDFLKALRQENLDNGLDLNAKEDDNMCLEQKQMVTDQECGAIVDTDHKTERLTNGVTDLGIGSPSGDILSSSLEAEQRLLREMGWDEGDDEDYVITEDDVREFEKLSKEINKQKNGFKKSLPSTWSPQHMPQIGSLSVNDKSNEPVSNLSDDSDSDLD